MSEWRSPESDPPPIDTPVLILYDMDWASGPIYDIAEIDDAGDWCNFLQGSSYFGLLNRRVIRWMPLPMRPAGMTKE